jgi:small subunit ribosomal protein S9
MVSLSSEIASGSETGRIAVAIDEALRRLPVEEVWALGLSRDTGVKKLFLEAKARSLQAEAERMKSRRVDVNWRGASTGTGKRKTSVAEVTLTPSARRGVTDVFVNGKPVNMYFSVAKCAYVSLSAMTLTKTLGLYDAHVTVRGGGITGQSEAVRHGIAKALVKQRPDLHRFLKSSGLLLRDPRMVERKKVGHVKSRKRPTWVKR